MKEIIMGGIVGGCGKIKFTEPLKTILWTVSVKVGSIHGDL